MWADTLFSHEFSSHDKTCASLLSRKNAVSYTAGLHLIPNTSVISWGACWPFRGCQQRKKSAYRPTISTSSFQNILVLLKGSSNSTCQQPPPLLYCLQTFPFSLHLSKHVAPFRGFMSRGRPAFLRTPGNQPSKVFLHSQNAKFSLPQGDVSEGLAFISVSSTSELIAAQWENFPMCNVPGEDWRD